MYYNETRLITIKRKVQFNFVFIFLLFLVFSLSSFLIVDQSENHNKDVPFKASFKIKYQRLGAPPILPVRAIGTGIASHLGKAEFEANYTVNFTVQPSQLDGTSTFTAANGDSFTTSFTGTASPNGDGTATSYVTHTITGGTGRFSDISGSFSAVSLHNLITDLGTLDLFGNISY
jgi:hypothetical protein